MMHLPLGTRQIGVLGPGTSADSDAGAGIPAPAPAAAEPPAAHAIHPRVLGGRVADCRDPGTWARMRLGARPEGRSSPGTIWCALHHALARCRPKAPSRPHRPRCDSCGVLSEPRTRPATAWLRPTPHACWGRAYAAQRGRLRLRRRPAAASGAITRLPLLDPLALFDPCKYAQMGRFGGCVHCARLRGQ